MPSAISLDFETYYSKKLKYGIRQLIAEQYCRHDLFDAYMVSASDGSSEWSGHPRDFNWSCLEKQTLLSHNRYFDNSVLNELIRRGQVPKVNWAAWHCTANLTAFLCNRRSLAESVEFLFGVRLPKEARDKADGKRWPEDFSEAERVEMLEYAKHDARWCWKLWDKFSHLWPDVERRLSNITIDQGMRGVQINTDLLDQYIYQTHEMRTKTEQVIPWIADSDDDDDRDSWAGFNAKPTSTKCIAEQCRRSGIPGCPVKRKDPEGYEEWEDTYTSEHRWIHAVSSWRSINKLYRTFQVVKERLRSDGTLPFALKYFGAHTGRWSGDAKVNMQNQRKEAVLCNEQGLMELNGKRITEAFEEKEETGKLPSWVKYAIDFRALIIPRPGKKMIICDLAQIEPRVLAWLAGDFAMLEKVRGGDSVYVAHARASMGFTDPSMDKKSALYKLAKARVLALGYGCGWEKFITMAQTLAGLDITVDDPEFVDEVDLTGQKKQVSGYGSNSKRIVKEYREQNKKITDLWSRLESGLRSSIAEDFVLTLPSGRSMRYGKVKAMTRIVKDKKTGLPRRQTEFHANTNGRYKHFYGGKLAENITQAAARDVFAAQIAAMEDRGWTNLFSAHDEAVLEVDQSVSAADVQAEMSKCPDWLPGCPIAAVAEEVSHYQK